MDICDIYITNGDTELTIPTGESVSERQTLCGGRAVYEACVKLKTGFRQPSVAAGRGTPRGILLCI